MGSFLCSPKLLLLLSAVPIAIILWLESCAPNTHRYEFYSAGWLRESTKWDEVNRRFIVSFLDGGGLGVVPLPDDGDDHETVLQEIPVVKNTEAVGNGSCGLFIDRPRNRVVVAIADVLGNTYSAVAAYDLVTWKRLFFTQLSNFSDDEKTFADDVTVDAEGNTYVTDAKGSKIWKVGVEGEVLSVIKSPLFHAAKDDYWHWYKELVSLNGIVYHPNGYLITSHTLTGSLFKIEINHGNRVTVVKVTDGGSLAIADGLELLSATKLIVAGANGVKLVESNDEWETAVIVGRSPGLKHRLVTGSTVKDGKVYINHAIGMGFPNKKHVLQQAIFS